MQQLEWVVDIQEQPLPQNQIRAFPCRKLNNNYNNNHYVIKAFITLALYKTQINAKARAL